MGFASLIPPYDFLTQQDGALGAVKSLSAVILAAALTCAAHSTGAAGGALPELRIETAAGDKFVYSVEIAADARARARGLMHRNALAADHGMLLLYETPRTTGIWMKNTRIPLDIIFIDAAGTITRIAEQAMPYSERIIPSSGKVRAVLEINGGQAAARGIRTGDRVVYAPVWPAE